MLFWNLMEICSFVDLYMNVIWSRCDDGAIATWSCSDYPFLTDCSLCAGRESGRAPGSAMAQVAGWFSLLSSTLGVFYPGGNWERFQVVWVNNSGFSSQKYEHVVVAVLHNPGSCLVEVSKVQRAGFRSMAILLVGMPCWLSSFIDTARECCGLLFPLFLQVTSHEFIKCMWQQLRKRWPIQ